MALLLLLLLLLLLVLCLLLLLLCLLLLLKQQLLLLLLPLRSPLRLLLLHRGPRHRGPRPRVGRHDADRREVRRRHQHRARGAVTDQGKVHAGGGAPGTLPLRLLLLLLLLQQLLLLLRVPLQLRQLHLLLLLLLVLLLLDVRREARRQAVLRCCKLRALAQRGDEARAAPPLVRPRRAPAGPAWAGPRAAASGVHVVEAGRGAVPRARLRGVRLPAVEPRLLLLLLQLVVARGTPERRRRKAGRPARTCRRLVRDGGGLRGTGARLAARRRQGCIGARRSLRHGI
jgi:hypothetical protein